MINQIFLNKTRTIAILFILFFSITSLSTAQTKVEKAADNFAKYSKDGDIKDLLKLYHPLVINDLGGEKKAKEILENNFKFLKEEGISVESNSVSEPVFYLKGASQEYALVPFKTVLDVSGNKTTINNYLFGISDTGAEDWKFINTGNYPEEKLMELFPEIQGKFEIPSQTFDSAQ